MKNEFNEEDETFSGTPERAEEDRQAQKIGEALTDRLTDAVHDLIHKDGIPPGIVALSLLTVCGNVSARHLGIRATVRLFRNCASDFEKKIPKGKERVN